MAVPQGVDNHLVNVSQLQQNRMGREMLEWHWDLTYAHFPMLKFSYWWLSTNWILHQNRGFWGSFHGNTWSLFISGIMSMKYSLYRRIYSIVISFWLVDLWGTLSQRLCNVTCTNCTSPDLFQVIGVSPLLAAAPDQVINQAGNNGSTFVYGAVRTDSLSNCLCMHN